MRRRILAALVLAMAVVAPGVRAEDREPTVYFFWSASCQFSKAARTFLLAAQVKDKALRVRDFEVDESIPNLRLLTRLYEKVGLPGVQVVPTIVIGHDVIVGYIDDASTGREIMEDVEKCRKAACKDAVQPLIDEQDRIEAGAMLPLPLPKAVCRREPGHATR